MFKVFSKMDLVHLGWMIYLLMKELACDVFWSL